MGGNIRQWHNADCHLNKIPMGLLGSIKSLCSPWRCHRTGSLLPSALPLRKAHEAVEIFFSWILGFSWAIISGLYTTGQVAYLSEQWLFYQQSTEIESKGSRAMTWLCPWLTMWFLASYLISLWVSIFLSMKWEQNGTYFIGWLQIWNEHM